MAALTTTTPLRPAHLAIEESHQHEDRHKTLHRHGCGHLIDPEPFEFPGGTTADLLAMLEPLGGAEEITELERALKPCARTALGA